MRRLAVALTLLALLGAAHWYRQRPIRPDAGVLVEAEPRQSEPASRAVIRHGAYELTPLADYTIEARLLSRHDYWFDAGSALAPTDFAVGWRRMSDSAVIARLAIEQSARWYTFRWRGAPPLPLDEMVRSSANMHLIPADAAVERGLARVRVGQTVELRGRLVEARRRDGWHWVSSLRRDDSGAGACELMLVKSVARR